MEQIKDLKQYLIQEYNINEEEALSIIFSNPQEALLFIIGKVLFDNLFKI